MTVNEITVVCDSPRHARGKVATLAVYHRYGTDWQRQPSRRAALRTRRGDDGRHLKRYIAAATADDAAAAADAMRPGPVGASRCKLCGATMPWEPHQSELERLAAHGESRISITQLIALRLGGR